MKLCADMIDQCVATYHSPLKNNQDQEDDTCQPYGRALWDLIELAGNQQYNQHEAVRIAAAAECCWCGIQWT